MRFAPGLLSLLMLCAGPVPARSEAPTSWPSPPARTALATPYGILEVHKTSYVYGSTLWFKGAEVQPQIQGIITISYAYRMSGREVALISVDTGDSNCPVRYRWITIGKTGYRITDAFGSCSATFRVEVKGRTLVLETPKPDQVDQVDAWSYDGKMVRQR